MSLTATSRVSCDQCGRSFSWKPELSGRKVRCKCGAPLVFPSQTPAAATRPAEEHVHQDLADGESSAHAPPTVRIATLRLGAYLLTGAMLLALATAIVQQPAPSGRPSPRNAARSQPQAPTSSNQLAPALALGALCLFIAGVWLVTQSFAGAPKVSRPRAVSVAHMALVILIAMTIYAAIEVTRNTAAGIAGAPAIIVLILQICVTTAHVAAIVCVRRVVVQPGHRRLRQLCVLASVVALIQLAGVAGVVLQAILDPHHGRELVEVVDVVTMVAAAVLAFFWVSIAARIATPAAARAAGVTAAAAESAG